MYSQESATHTWIGHGYGSFDRHCRLYRGVALGTSARVKTLSRRKYISRASEATRDKVAGEWVGPDAFGVRHKMGLGGGVLASSRETDGSQQIALSSLCFLDRCANTRSS